MVLSSSNLYQSSEIPGITFALNQDFFIKFKIQIESNGLCGRDLYFNNSK